VPLLLLRRLRLLSPEAKAERGGKGAVAAGEDLLFGVEKERLRKAVAVAGKAAARAACCCCWQDCGLHGRAATAAKAGVLLARLP
jgi:hypothetical protein